MQNSAHFYRWWFVGIYEKVIKVKADVAAVLDSPRQHR
jgi:hypothetical protein